MKNLNDFIMVQDDVLPQKLVDKLLNEYKESSEWKAYDTGIRSKSPAQVILISHPKVIKNSPMRQEIYTEVLNHICKGFDKYHQKYSRRDQGLNFISVKGLVGLRLIKYKKGQSLGVHTDLYTDPDTNIQRWPVVTFTLNLNNNFEGGELDILEGDHIFKAQPRQCIFFPSNFLYPHAVRPVKRGIRYCLVGWFL